LIGREGFSEGFRRRKMAVNSANTDVGCLRDGVELQRFPIIYQGPRSVHDAASVARGVLAQRGLLRGVRALHAFTLPIESDSISI